MIKVDNRGKRGKMMEIAATNVISSQLPNSAMTAMPPLAAIFETI